MKLYTTLAVEEEDRDVIVEFDYMNGEIAIIDILDEYTGESINTPITTWLLGECWDYAAGMEVVE